jgi:alpha-galactosidase
MSKRLAVVGCCLMIVAGLARAAERAEIPLDAPDDAVMADARAVQDVADWTCEALLGDPPKNESAATVTLRRQDHNVLRFNQSCMETKIKIGRRHFARGLGTHANSEIAVSLPQGAKSFKAMVGVDNNYDTQGIHGSVQFSVEIAGKEVYRSRTLKGGDEAAAVNVAIPEGARELVLKVDTTPDGPAYDQADWADAQVVTSDGRIVWLTGDDTLMDRTLPFSFVYGGVDAKELLKSWKRTVAISDENDRVRHRVVWADPTTKLEVTVVAIRFKRYPAVEWLLYFENRGSQDTPILENIQALDVVFRTSAARQPAVLHRLNGDSCDERSFMPFDTPLDAGKTISMAPRGGRPSNTSAFPFFNLEYAGRGAIVGIGWTGQWTASLKRSPDGPTRLRAGMEKTHLVLHSGEKIRSPRVLLMPWKGDRIAAHQRFRRLLMFCYAPKLNDRPLQLPFALQCFDRYFGSRPDWSSEKGQIAAAKATHRIGCDHHWLDAAWFLHGFPEGVGNWFCDPEKFRNGLKPVSDACHRSGNKFILWFEPERVAKGSQIAVEHPEFVFGGNEGGLFKLGDPAARKWMTDLLSQRIGEYGVDVFRSDFNIDPLEYWRGDDAPGRQGMAEIRYVEGHYALWDELTARHPGLWIDNCASGGRRIDLETIMRSVPLWRSDTCGANRPDWDHTQTQGLSLYIPLFTACSWTPDAYEMRSSATGGAIFQFDYLADGFPFEKAKTAVDEARENSKYWYGDFTPLTQATLSGEQWAAYQFHRADLNAGIVLAFRRAASPYSSMTLELRSIDPARNYVVELIDDARKKTERTISGRELAAGLEVRLPKKRSSLVVRYRPVSQQVSR